MKRSLFTFLLVLVLGAQGPLAAYASRVADGITVGSVLAVGGPDSTAGAHSSYATPDSCCPGGGPGANCCFTLCLTSAGAMECPVLTRGYSRTLLPIRSDAPAFTSRGDAPLIRPPIL